jgi:glutathione S-transferase
MTHQLYYSPGACSLAAHIVLEELGADYELRLVSIADGMTTHPDYLAINPKARVPALAIPGEDSVLTELPAILVYLATLYPEGRLLPAAGDVVAIARCQEWLAWLSGWVHGVGFALLWRPGRFAEDAHHADLSARGREVIEAAFADIEAKLVAGQNWALPSGYSVVDPFLLVLFRWGGRIGLPMGERYPVWKRLALRMVERPAVQRAMVREGVEIVF